MPDEKIVSVIIPAYNAAKTLSDTIRSVQQQTYQNFEIIIVNDGSTDETRTIGEYFVRIDKRIRLLNQHNNGSCIARNNGLKAARGHFVCVLDSDDLWPSYKLMEQVSLLNHHPKSISIGGVKRFSTDSGEFRWYHETYPRPYTTKLDYYKNLLYLRIDEMVLLNTLCAPKEYLIKEGWDPKYKTAHDWELWFRLSKNYHIITENKIYQYYRKHENSATKNYSIYTVAKSHLAVIEKHGHNVLTKQQTLKNITDRLLTLSSISYEKKNYQGLLYLLNLTLKYKYCLSYSKFYKHYLKLLLKSISNINSIKRVS